MPRSNDTVRRLSRCSSAIRYSAAITATLALGTWSTTPVSANAPGDDPTWCEIAQIATADDRRVALPFRSLQQNDASSAHAAAKLERIGWTYVAQARTSYDPGWYTAAEAAARCVLVSHGERPDALLLLGHVHHALHRFAKAESVGRRLTKRRGAWFDHALLGDALMERGALDQAAIHYQKMMDLRPGSQAYSRASHMRWLHGDLQGAVELGRMALTAASPRDREARAWLRTRLARYLVELGRRDIADALLEQTLSEVSNYPAALQTAATLQLASGACRSAIPSLSLAAAVDRAPQTVWAKIEALQACGETERAEEQHAALLRHGASDDARTTSLYLATSGREVETALRLARNELAQRRDIHTWDALAWALFADGQLDEAYNASQKALSTGTQDSRVEFHCGTIALARGRHEEAADLLRRAQRGSDLLMPSERRRLAQSYAKLGAVGPS